MWKVWPIKNTLQGAKHDWFKLQDVHQEGLHNCNGRFLSHFATEWSSSWRFTNWSSQNVLVYVSQLFLSVLIAARNQSAAPISNIVLAQVGSSHCKYHSYHHTSISIIIDVKMQTLYLNFKVTMTHGSSAFMAFNHSDLQSCPPISTPPAPSGPHLSKLQIFFAPKHPERELSRDGRPAPSRTVGKGGFPARRRRVKLIINRGEVAGQNIGPNLNFI